VAKAQRDGLRVLTYAKWKYVTGADVLEFFARLGEGGGDGDGGQAE
jgi:hypothetical protein